MQQEYDRTGLLTVCAEIKTDKGQLAYFISFVFGNNFQKNSLFIDEETDGT